MKARYRFLRAIGCGVFTASFIVILNEMSDLPPNEVGFMGVVWEMWERDE